MVMVMVMVVVPLQLYAKPDRYLCVYVEIQVWLFFCCLLAYFRPALWGPFPPFLLKAYLNTSLGVSREMRHPLQTSLGVILPNHQKKLLAPQNRTLAAHKRATARRPRAAAPQAEAEAAAAAAAAAAMRAPAGPTTPAT